MEGAEAQKARNWLLDEQAGKHTVTVGMRRKNGKRSQATGVCITYEGEYFVVTAAHVLEPWPETLYLIPKPPGTYAMMPPATARSQGFVPSIVEALPPKNPKDDVTVLRLSGRPKDLPEEHFYVTDLTPPPPVRPEKQVLLLGHPVALTTTRPVRGDLIPESCPMSDAPRVQEVPRSSKLRRTGEYSDVLHFALDFPEHPGSEVNEPEGLSGGGVWLPYLVSGGAYQTGVRLAGIQIGWHQIGWHRGERLLVVTRINRVWLILGEWNTGRSKTA